MQHTASPDPSAHHAVFSATALLPRIPRVPDIPATGALWVLVSDQGVAIGNGEHPQIYAEAGPSQPGIVEYLGHIGTVPCYAAELQQGAPIPGDRVIIGIRDLYGRIPDRDLAVAAFAVRTIGSSKTSRFWAGAGMRPCRFFPSGQRDVRPAIWSSIRGSHRRSSCLSPGVRRSCWPAPPGSRP